MVFNERFVWAVRREQERRGYTQAAFAQHIGAKQPTFCKFCQRGVKDNLTILILRKFPHLVIYLSEDTS